MLCSRTRKLPFDLRHSRLCVLLTGDSTTCLDREGRERAHCRFPCRKPRPKALNECKHNDRSSDFIKRLVRFLFMNTIEHGTAQAWNDTRLLRITTRAHHSVGFAGACMSASKRERKCIAHQSVHRRIYMRCSRRMRYLARQRLDPCTHSLGLYMRIHSDLS